MKRSDGKLPGENQHIMKKLTQRNSVFAYRVTRAILMAVGLALVTASAAPSAELTAKEIVVKANDLLRGKSSTATATMTVVKPDWSRKMSMKMWMLEPSYAMILITEPAKDKGTVTLKRKNEIWNWVPAIQRVIKIPPSMMMQPWMGSDFTNDDLVRESSIIDDYTQDMIGDDTVSGYDCYKIRLIPTPEAGVVWGKVIMWISRKGYLELKTEYYDEDSTLVKYMIGSDIKVMGGRTLPSHWEMIPVDKPDEKTILDYSDLQFNVDIKPSYFSEQNMKRVR
ncbi:MAG TPA: outer membrane lipoprotein-sorting protein [candidate division Zixibacteria bacterium]|nr:outer membrane lipoprotein-sorting protein [candidate division Zixibacteria bacterium]